MEELNATPTKKYTQQQRICQHLDRFGFITPKACILRVPMITTKLSTRIGEMERKVGVKAKRTKDAEGFVRYEFTRDAIETLKAWYHVQ